MFQMTVHGDTLAELGAKLLAAADALGNGSVARSATTGRVTAASATDAPTSSREKTGSTQSDTSKQSDAGSELDYEQDVRPHVVKLSKVHGRDAALDVLKHFDNAEGEPCANGKDLQPGDWAAAVKKIKAAHKRLDAEKTAADAD